MLKMCKSMDGAGAIPQRPVQIEKDCPRGHACYFLGSHGGSCVARQRA
jgi:hypothetical protein